MFDLFLPPHEKKLKSSLKNILGISPKNITLYTQAFRHNSVAKEIKEGVKDSNERLEYLGDSVLNAVIADYLFRKFPYKDEGFLTKMRSKIVSRNHLNQLALKLGLNKFLSQTNDPNLKFSSMNGDAFEALIGAIYMDKGFYAAQNFILNRILKFHVDVEKILLTETDFKSKLIEWSQRERQEVRFTVVEEQGNGYDKQFMIAVMVQGEAVAQAQHFSKKKAEQLSAEATCIKLGIT
ncbi:MAG: ribonuclease III [Bacteroidetes bacterium]|nr:MAG: ribonuclease III [Bacteroidota bacterium]